MVDSHLHLDDKTFDEDRDAVVERALEAGITRMLAIGSGDGPPDFEAGIRMAERYPQVWASICIHPHHADRATEDGFARLRELASHPKVIALGEIGLEYHYDFVPREVQHRVFIRQIELAGELRLPILIHTRDAWDDTFRLLEKYWAPADLPGVIHCFSGGPAEAARCLSLGFYLSFAGQVTYPKAVEIQEACRATPLSRILVETDSPYLSPVPRRGKRNEPANVVHTAAKVAELKEVSLVEVSSVTTENFNRLVAETSKK